MKTIETKFVRAREIADIIWINRQQRIKKSKNKDWELMNYFNKVFQRRKSAGLHHETILWQDRSEKWVERYLIDKTTADLLLMEKWYPVKNISEESKKVYIELQDLKLKRKEKLKGNIWKFIKWK